MDLLKQNPTPKKNSRGEALSNNTFILNSSDEEEILQKENKEAFE